MDERLRFVARLLEGEKTSRLCEEFGISRKPATRFTVTIGIAGLTDSVTAAGRYRYANRLPLAIWIVRLKKETCRLRAK